MVATDRSKVSDHYARSNLIDAIRDGVDQIGKTTATVTINDLAPVDEFHIGGRKATEEIIAQLGALGTDHLLDVGCGLGGAARFAADRYKCRVTGIDLTADYVEAGRVLCKWVGLDHRVSLHHANALSFPFSDDTFDAAYMLHVGMNIEDKTKLCSEVARILRPGALFGVYDVMRMADSELTYPVPWATTPETNALARPQAYRNALESGGFDILSERDRTDFALAHFQLQSKLAGSDKPSPLGLHTLMGDRRRDQVRNMIDSISAGRIAPIEMIARKA